MSTVYVSNMMPYELKLIVNRNLIGTLPATSGPSQGPQPTGFSFSASGDGNFGTQNFVQLWTEIGIPPEYCSLAIDSHLIAMADIQLFIFQGFLALIEGWRARTVTLDRSD
jgi:hypothetical protein